MELTSERRTVGLLGICSTDCKVTAKYGLCYIKKKFHNEKMMNILAKSKQEVLTGSQM